MPRYVRFMLPMCSEIPELIKGHRFAPPLGSVDQWQRKMIKWYQYYSLFIIFIIKDGKFWLMLQIQHIFLFIPFLSTEICRLHRHGTPGRRGNWPPARRTKRRVPVARRFGHPADPPWWLMVFRGECLGGKGFFRLNFLEKTKYVWVFVDSMK